jgi:hypothetical protein
MNNKFLYAGKCFVCLLVHSLLWGCTSLNDAPAESDNAETIITFTMEVGGNVSGTATRANDTWNDSYNEESSTYDSSIDPDDVQVALMDKDGAFVADVTTISCAYEEESGCYRYYGIIDETKQITVGATYRCMVVANAGNKIAFNNLSGSAPTYSAGQLPNANNSPFKLPMWGVASFSANKGGDSQDVGEIYMLRSVAKCRVKLSEALATLGYSLENVKLSNYSSTAYLLPGGYASAESTQALTFSGSFHPVDNSMTGAALTLFAEPVTEDTSDDSSSSSSSSSDNSSSADSDSGNSGSEGSGSSSSSNGTATRVTSYICYMPECSVSEDSPVNLTLDLIDANSNRLSFTVDLTKKQITSIIRNHLYDFVVTGISYGSKIEVKVNDWVQPDETTLDYDQQISFTDKDIKWEGYNSINKATSDNEQNTISLLSNIDLNGTVNIKTPLGATFVAALTTDSDADAIAFLHTDANGDISASTEFEQEIDGNPITFTITTTQKAPSSQITAKLTLLVRFANKTTKKIEDFGEWLIIQPAGQTSDHDFSHSSGGDSEQSSSGNTNS